MSAAAVEVAMEFRICPHAKCGRRFRVAATSKQIFCSQYCANMEKDKCHEVQRASSAAELTTANVTVDATNLIRSSERNRSRDGELAIEPTRKRKGRRCASAIGPTPQLTTSAASVTNDETRRRPVPTSESTTQKIESGSSRSSTQLEIVETQLTDSTARSPDLNAEICQSISLLSDTGKHLFGLMKGLNPSNLDPEVRLHDADRVKAAAECGKQIISSMRMQLDILKFAKEVLDTKGAK